MCCKKNDNFEISVKNTFRGTYCNHRLNFAVDQCYWSVQARNQRGAIGQLPPKIFTNLCIPPPENISWLRPFRGEIALNPPANVLRKENAVNANANF